MQTFYQWLEARAVRGISKGEMEPILAGNTYKSLTRPTLSIFASKTPEELEDPNSFGVRLAKDYGRISRKDGKSSGFVLDLDVPDEEMSSVYDPNIKVSSGAAGIPEMRPEYIKKLRRIRSDGDEFVLGKSRDKDKFRDTYNRLFGKK